MQGPAGQQRRLAAILAADVAGYSRHVALDEAGALSALRSLRDDVLAPALAAHGGRLFKAMGDGFFAEVPSTVGALRCALEVQARLAGRGPDAPRLRIGVHAGDVAVEGDDLLGDDVNVAARLQALAEPGGVCLSARVREDAAGRLELSPLEDLGERRLRNIPSPVRVFRLAPGAAAEAGAAAVPLPPPLAALDRPALAVLPFADLSGEAGQGYFADGVTEELITQLSRARWFYVIARNSTFTYKGRAVDVRRVGRELGVRYVLEGSVRRAGGRVRIAGRLVEAEGGHHVWADRFDGTAEDIFELQDRVAEAVAGAIEPSLRHAEVSRAQAKPTGSLTAYDLYLRALPRFYETTPAGSDAALDLLRRAVAADPGFALGKALAALCHGMRKVQGWGDGGTAEEGTALARAALAGAGEDPTALRLGAHALAILAGDDEAATAAIGRALALNPNSGQVAGSAGWIFNYACRPRDAIAAFERAMRLSPLDPEMGYMLAGVGVAHLIAGDHERALDWAARSVRQSPAWTAGLRPLIVANWLLGRREEARRAAASLVAAAPRMRVALAVPRFRDAAFEARYREALIAAGVPA